MFGSEACVCGLSTRGGAVGGVREVEGLGAGERESSQAGPGTNGS